MFKTLVATAALLFSFASIANEKIAPIFEELEYKLSVEWDQKDQTFYNETVKSFEKNLEGLAAQGVRPHELLDYVQANLKDQKLASELAQIVNSVDLDSLSLEESKELLNNYLEGLNNTGANYSGRYSYSYFWVYYVGFGGIFYYSYYYYSTDYYYYDCYYNSWGDYICY